MAQLVTVELDLITECKEIKTREDIWEHSYQASLKYGDGDKLNEETQFGLTNEACWSTNRIEINTHRLWYSNYYFAQWTDTINVSCIMFGFVALYCTSIIIYILRLLIEDILAIAQNKLHEKSKLYDHLMLHTNNIHSGLNKVPKTESIWKDGWRKFKQFYDEWLGTDTIGFIIRMILIESIEISLQTNALLLYNGYQNDPSTDSADNVHLAAKPEFIKLLAVFIAINCFGDGIVWLLYACVPSFCHGLKFKLIIFVMDQCADVFYSIFPFIVIIYDTYNDDSAGGYEILLGQLNKHQFIINIFRFIYSTHFIM